MLIAEGAARLQQQLRHLFQVGLDVVEHRDAAEGRMNPGWISLISACVVVADAIIGYPVNGIGHHAGCPRP
jgi:hypothetical protein